ncbi:hypothetical protein RhiJN_16343 [Ceratobasidium sp. AG-Ba]|nr:hypothetical protein RhiJN_16343 [Ceratobasidium sp. AG-Ba]
MPRTFWGYPATNYNLKRRAINANFSCPFAKNLGLADPMAREIYDRLEPYGPFKFSTCELNGKPGYVFILGPYNIPREEISSEIAYWLEKTFKCPPRLFTYDRKMRLFTSPRIKDETKVDTVRRLSTMMQVSVCVTGPLLTLNFNRSNFDYY